MKRAHLGLIFLTLLLDLIGFSILFPIYRELLAFYEPQMAPLLGWLPAEWLTDEHTDRRLGFIGGILLSLYSLCQFFLSAFLGSPGR